MERCDFASVAALLRADLLDGSFDNQMEFVEGLFSAFLTEMETYLDMGLVSKWLNGLAKPSPAISRFYQESDKRGELEITLEDVILPCLSDSAMVVQNVYALLIGDSSVSESKKAELSGHYPCGTKTDEAAFLTDVLLFGLSRPFMARDIRKPNLLTSGALSPALGDFVIDDGLPKPCRHFCGRDRELDQLHAALCQNGTVFLNGIPGIGKSELAKAYAKGHRKDYTNILFLSYTGSLKADIAGLVFADDLPDEDSDARFRKHNRFLRTLKEDTLLIIDNFNPPAAGDGLLDVVLKYRCRVLFTTRNSIPGQACLTLEEIQDESDLLRLAAGFYSEAERNRDVVWQIIETVHKHTFAVELAARLLETGILEPREVLERLRTQRASFDATDRISANKDGKSHRATYYDHIHTLFALFRLADSQKRIMCSAALLPTTGIPARLFGKWLRLSDLNEINELVVLGFLHAKPGNRVTLHSMTREVTVSDLPPSVTNCHTLLESIRTDCQLHGADLPYFRLLRKTFENAIRLTEKDDLVFYLLLLEDVFQAYEKYRDESGMRRLVDEMDVILSDQTVGSDKDRALLLDCRAACETNTARAIRDLQEALTLLPEVNSDNALLVSNLNANLGGLYRTAKQYELAKRHMEAAVKLLEEYGLVGAHDSLAQIVNYAVLLNDMGEAERGLTGLRKMDRILREQNPDSQDHALVLETMGNLSLSLGNRSQAANYYQKAMQIYETIWIDEPDTLSEKRQQLKKI